MNWTFLALGSLFGFILSRAGATNYDYTAKLFLFQDLQLLWVIVVAVIVGAIGIAIFKKTQLKSISGSDINLSGKPATKGYLWGGALFGVGWGLTGTCPGTAATMLGEGKLMAFAVIAGIIFGSYLFAWLPTNRRKT